MATSTAANPRSDYFGIRERGSTVSREVIGGLVNFLVAAYIIFLNPAILSFAGIPGLEGKGLPFAPTLAMTCLSAGLMTIFMGLYGRYPYLLAPGLGINAVVAFSLIANLGLSPGEAMGVILMEGVAITLLVLTGLREAVMNAIPNRLKRSIAVGIGFFILFIGLVDGGVVVMSGVPAAPMTLGNFNNPVFMVMAVGLGIALISLLWNIRGGMLLTILATTVLSIVVNAAYGNTLWAKSPGVAVMPAGVFSLPDFSTFGIGLNFGVFAKVGLVGGLLAVFSLMLADFFDTMGTLLGVGEQAGFVDKDGQFPEGHLRRLLLVDSIAAAFGGLVGASSNTTYIESGAGVAEGARTGLASLVTGVLFLLAMFIAPLAGVIPPQATAPVLVVVGFLMFSANIVAIVADMDGMSNADKVAEGAPALVTMLFMPFSYSITAGIGAGFITYTVLQLARGRMVSLLLMLTSVAYVVYFLFHI